MTRRLCGAGVLHRRPVCDLITVRVIGREDAWRGYQSLPLSGRENPTRLGERCSQWRSGNAVAPFDSSSVSSEIMIDHIDHIVLTTSHEAACIRFYTDVLGMPGLLPVSRTPC